MRRRTSKLSGLAFIRAAAVFCLFCWFAPCVLGGDADDIVCLDCHDDVLESLEKTAHEIVTTPGQSISEVTCTSCHANGEVHAEDPSIENIGNPATMNGYDAREACSSCHRPHLELDNYGFDVHSELQMSCSSCHQVHGGDPDHLVSSKAEFCLKCHDEVASSFSRRSQHPLHEGNITCLNCHSFTKQRDHALAYDLERICQDCHPEEGGPFPYEHEVTNGFSVEGSGCMACHDPHGSENDFLLKQKGKELCLQCHMPPIGHETLPALHGDVQDIDNCYACHSDVHGSFVSHKLLDPMLQSRLGSPQDCSQCHNLMD